MLTAVFDPRANGLNFLRLLLASGVIFWHSFPLTGTEVIWPPLGPFFGSIFVDGFFAISGFLILSSWDRNPNWWQYLSARLLRIMPGFWVCLIVTAAVLAPIGILLGGAGFPEEYVPSAFRYLWANSILTINQFDIAGTPSGVPYPEVWNGSLWTLRWEFLCYLGILALGLVRLARHRLTSVVVFIGLLLVNIAVPVLDIENSLVRNGISFGLMFAAGMVVYALRDVIPVRGWLMGVAGVLIAVSVLLPDHRLLAALPVAYLMLTAGALIRSPRLRFRNDLSYGVYIYGFPVQQVLVLAGASVLGPLGLGVVALLCVLPLAAASWFLVEKRAMRLKPRGRRPAETVQEDALATGEPPTRDAGVA